MSLGLAACLGALLALASPAGDGALLAAPAAVAVGVVGAAALHGRLDWLSVALGAPSALAWTLLAGRGRSDLGAAACLMLWAAPGLVTRGATRAVLLPAGLAASASLLGAHVLARYARAALEVQAAACAFAGAALTMAVAVVATAPASEATNAGDTGRADDAAPPT